MTVRDSLKAVGPYAAATVLAAVCFVAGGYRPSVDPAPAPTPSISLPASVDVPVGGGAVKVEVNTRSKTAHVRWLTYPGDAGHVQVLQYPDHAQVISLVPGSYWVGADLASADGDAVWCRIDAGTGPRPPPIPPIPPVPPEPKPPTPIPVSSFRVIFVYESGKTLAAAQISTMDAKAVRDYLTANTTPEDGLAGWRKYDKDQSSAKDSPAVNAMWQAVKSKLTTLPCVAVEVNGHVEIVPLAATPAAMVETFKRYKSGGA